MRAQYNEAVKNEKLRTAQSQQVLDIRTTILWFDRRSSARVNFSLQLRCAGTQLNWILVRGKLESFCVSFMNKIFHQRLFSICALIIIIYYYFGYRRWIFVGPHRAKNALHWIFRVRSWLTACKWKGFRQIPVYRFHWCCMRWILHGANFAWHCTFWEGPDEKFDTLWAGEPAQKVTCHGQIAWIARFSLSVKSGTWINSVIAFIARAHDYHFSGRRKRFPRNSQVFLCHRRQQKWIENDWRTSW